MTSKFNLKFENKQTRVCRVELADHGSRMNKITFLKLKSDPPEFPNVLSDQADLGDRNRDFIPRSLSPNEQKSEAITKSSLRHSGKKIKLKPGPKGFSRHSGKTLRLKSGPNADAINVLLADQKLSVDIYAAVYLSLSLSFPREKQDTFTGDGR